MENEAASVNDREWAMETRWAARQFDWRAALGVAGVFTLLGITLTLMVQFSWRHETPDQLWLGIMVMVALVGALLGGRGVGALEAGTGALAFLPGAWLAVVALQALLGDRAPTSPGFVDEGVTVLAVLAACAAGCVGSWRKLPVRGRA